jgi:hypothetical protein
MSTIEIDWLHDEHNCETCGWSLSQGAIVRVDGKQILELRPRAHCLGSENWDDADVYKLILRKLGYQVGERANLEEGPAQPADPT